MHSPPDDYYMQPREKSRISFNSRGEKVVQPKLSPPQQPRQSQKKRAPQKEAYHEDAYLTGGGVRVHLEDASPPPSPQPRYANFTQPQSRRHQPMPVRNQEVVVRPTGVYRQPQHFQRPQPQRQYSMEELYTDQRPFVRSLNF